MIPIFERLLFAQKQIIALKKMISDLKIEKGVIESERDEVKDELNKYLNSNVKGDWKKQYQLSLRAMKRYRKKIKTLQKANSELITKLCNNYEQNNINQ